VTDELTPDVTPLVVDAIGLAALIDVSVREVHRLDSMGGIPEPVRFGKCKRWVRREIEDWLNAGTPSRREWNAIRRPPA
jgi:predicted DNA-binding transcriptional regulator AlpA